MDPVSPPARRMAVRRVGSMLATLPLVTALPLLAATSSAIAQDYPSRPIRLIVPYSAGGASDAPMRVIAQQMSRQLNQQVVVENKPGMGSMLGGEIAAKSAPDGYTLMLGSNPQVIGASLYRNLTFDPVEDFEPISLFGREPAVLVVHPSFPAKTLAEFIAHVKARPGAVDYASSGNGSAQHLFTAMFLSRADLKMTHIPYRGSAQVTTDLLGGQVKVALPGLATMVPHIREGRLRALAVTGSRRSPLLPDVPTVEESGFAGFSAYVWNGLLAPKGTPRPIIDKLHGELVTALQAPPVAAFLKDAAIETITDTPEAFAAFLRQERDRAAAAVREAGVRIE